MSGHNKWSTIKRKKGANDAKRGQMFTKVAKEIILAAKKGGNPEMNPALRAAIEKARSYNMPKDNINNAIKKGTGELPGVVYEEIVYEGYAPYGIALLIEVITDNKNRSTSEVRHALSHAGGSLAETGAVAWNFERKGQIFVKKDKAGEDALMEIITDAGAEDMKTEEDGFYVVCNYKDLFNISAAIEAKKIEVETAELTYIAQNPITLEPEQVKKILRIIENIEDMDDVQNVFTNMNIPDDLQIEEE